MNKPANQPSSKNSSKPGATSHTNFIEALKTNSGSLARDVATGYARDFVGGTAKQAVDTIFNAGSASQSPEDTQPEQQSSIDFAEFLKSNEAKVRARDRVKYEYESSETVIFNRRQQEVTKKIDQIRIELKQLARSIVTLDSTTETTIEQELVEPGTYHLNFFDKLLEFIQNLKKRVEHSHHWASLQSRRSRHKSYYWQQASQKVGGTKYMLSQERTIATQTG